MTPSLSGLPPIRTALIGYGFAGKTFHAPLIRAVPALCLEHVVSRDPVRVHADLPEARVSADPDEAIEAADIDLVVIASPNATHASLAERALRAGKHVVVDKPFTVTLAEARRLADLARERPGQVLSVFQNRRFDSDFLAVEAALCATSSRPSSASVRRSATAGANTTCPAPGCGSTSARTCSTRHCACSAYRSVCTDTCAGCARAR